MSTTARFYPASELALKTDTSGAQYWSVHLAQTMLTYFEVPARTLFDFHQHESEQITHVVEGELFFQIGETITRVGPGEVIAIPSMVVHSVFTRENSAKAFDAWAPLPPQYLTKSDAD